MNGATQIVFTTGTLAGSEREFYEIAVETCEVLRCQGVLVTPHTHQIPNRLPSRVKHVEYTPFDELFAGASAVVHHGGIGTSACALAAGIPQVVRPLAGDQFDNAHRIERLGVGRMITKRHIRAAELAKTIRSLLESTKTRCRCQYWRSRVCSQDGLARIADLVEEHIGLR